MDLDHLIRTRDYIFFSEILVANKNVKLINNRLSNRINFYYCGHDCMEFEKKIKTSSLLKEIGNCSMITCDIDRTLLILSLDSSYICRQQLKQKSYHKILLYCLGYDDLFWSVALNIIVTENDLGIITRRKDISQYDYHEKKNK